MSRVEPENIPSWLSKVASHHEGWQWIQEEEASEIAQAMTSRYAGRGPAFVPLQPEIVKLCRMLVERLRPVATIPAGPRRPDVVDHRATIFLEINSPRHMIVCVHHELPPLLWFPAGDSAAQLAEKMAPYMLTTTAPETVHFSARRRGFIGTPGILEMSRDDLFAHWSTSPLAESLFWGSAFENDPWPEHISQKELASLSEKAAMFLSQHPDGPWGVSFRAIASRAIVSFEDHDGLWTLSLHYEPAAHQELIQALNAQFQQQWPLDLPVDLCAVLIGFHFEEATQLEALILEANNARPVDLSELIFNLYAYACVTRHDLSGVRVLRPFLTHFEPDVREAVLDIALRHGLDFSVVISNDVVPVPKS